MPLHSQLYFILVIRGDISICLHENVLPMYPEYMRIG